MGGIAYIARDLPAPVFSEEENCRLAVEACPNGMLLTDGDGRILLANAATERLFGYQRHELIGEPAKLVLPEGLADGHDCAGVARFPEPCRLEENRVVIGRRRDGTEFPLEIGFYPIHHGESARVLGLIIDAGERNRADRLKDEFVSTVSHELRTPLTSIAGSLGLLVGGAAGPLPEPAARLIRIAQSNSQRLVRLINDILDIEKIESGEVAFRFKRLDVRAVLEQVIESNRGYADGFQVGVRLEADAPAAEIYADPDRFAQVITNLLSNAIKFSPPGDEVWVAITERDQTVRITIRDHGPGIPQEFRPRIFHKFAQADATDARQKGGTGLGLSIVKQIVTRLGGTVGFEDAPGGGTIFSVVLPGWIQVAAREIDRETSQKTARILLCEDNLDAAFALRFDLRPLGFSTDFAHSPADAITRVQANRYDAVLVDLDLPDGDGLSLIRTLRAQPDIYKTPIVVISSGTRRDKAALDGQPLNVLECVQKPVDVDRLAQILDQAIVRGGNGRPQILHVDDDCDVLEIVAQTLESTANVVSVASLEDARCALLMHHFDLAILDISLGSVSGLDLLPDLRSCKGAPIPVIVFSAHAEIDGDCPVEAHLDKSSAASLKDLLLAVHDRLMLRSARPPGVTA
jgi:PAS domain S-box-containing protein